MTELSTAPRAVIPRKGAKPLDVGISSIYSFLYKEKEIATGFSIPRNDNACVSAMTGRVGDCQDFARLQKLTS